MDDRKWTTLRSATDYRRMPWKNGGGETVEIAVCPPGATVADFDWRLSMATVAGDGPFSSFPGIDRTLSILEGEGMRLDIEGRAPVTVILDSEPLEFSADLATSAHLVAGPITDLNVMTKRKVFSHRVCRRIFSGAQKLTSTADWLFVLCHKSSFTLQTTGIDAKLADLDIAFGPAPASLDLFSEDEARMFVIEIFEAGLEPR